jgi:Family of unknown function (DUF5335)
MRTKEVTRNEWNSFFNIFSKQHEGWLATLEVFGDEIGAQTEAVELPFEGISLNSEDKTESLVINFGKPSADHVSHTVERPSHVWLRETDEGAHDSLEIEEEGNQKTLLRFRSPVLPELVDGIV